MHTEKVFFLVCLNKKYFNEILLNINGTVSKQAKTGSCTVKKTKIIINNILVKVVNTRLVMWDVETQNLKFE